MEDSQETIQKIRCTVCGDMILGLFSTKHNKIHICKVCKQLLVALVIVIILTIIVYLT